jgi:sortase A
LAWYALGGQPGGAGNVVIDGHVDNALTTSGVFENLDQLQKGDYVTVEDNAGHAVAYKVSSVQYFDASSTPPDSIFAATGPSQLILITCEGEWVPSLKEFNQRLVVTAEPAY